MRRRRELESRRLPLSGTELALGAKNKRHLLHGLNHRMGLSYLFARGSGHRCTERCPRAAGAAAPREERQHMGTASAKSAGARPSPASVPAAEAPQRQGGIAAKGGGGEGKVIL